MENIDLVSVDNVLRPKKDNIVDVLKYFHVKNIDEVSRQYAIIHLVQWQNVDETVKFWSEVSNYQDANGKNSLSAFGIFLMSLPWSNADVKRVFSQMNLAKTKFRNRMHLDTLTQFYE